MNQSIDFVDKSDFKCFRINHEHANPSNFQVYFGQVQYIRENDQQIMSENDYIEYLAELEQEKKRVEELKAQLAN